jgi:diadenosine tetraphosphatase ApaH/serine/threonine PP2A family protein phosphatase
VVISYTFHYTKIFCVHSGLSPSASTIEDLAHIDRYSNPSFTNLPWCSCPYLVLSAHNTRFSQNDETEGVMVDLVWSHPNPDEGWGFNPAGTSYLHHREVGGAHLADSTASGRPGAGYEWGPDITATWCAQNRLEKIVRAQFTMEVLERQAALAGAHAWPSTTSSDSNV